MNQDTFKIAVSSASVYPNSVNSLANKTQSQPNIRKALAGVADLNALIINCYKKSKKSKSDFVMPSSSNTDAWVVILKKEMELVQISERFLNLS